MREERPCSKCGALIVAHDEVTAFLLRLVGDVYCVNCVHDLEGAESVQGGVLDMLAPDTEADDRDGNVAGQELTGAN